MLEYLNPIALASENETILWGKKISSYIKAPFIIYLEGDLGSGKTTFTKGFLQGFGYKGAVKSPTFTLVEEYSFDLFHVYHFDIYRIQNAYELEYIGIREYFDDKAIVLIEWPERGQEILPMPDLTLKLSLGAHGRILSPVICSQRALGLKTVLTEFL